ncbi:reverse transcriptase, partial [Thalictrum thalictroides]
MILNWGEQQEFKKGKFRFFNHWTKHQEFMGIVEEKWGSRVTGNPMMQLTSKLKLLKVELKRWSKKHFSNINHRVKEAKEKLNKIQADIQERPFDNDLAVLEKAVIQQYIDISNAEEASLKQKAGDDRISLGDENSAYFHRLVKGRYSKNRILMLLDENNNEIFDKDLIKDMLLKYFSKLLGERHQIPFPSDLLDDMQFDTIQYDEGAWMERDIED